MSSEYAWSQIEPATAILCASIITYRPIFSKIKKDILTLSNKFSPDSTNRESEGHWTDMENSKTSTMRWPVASDFAERANTDYSMSYDAAPRCAIRYAETSLNSYQMKPLPTRPGQDSYTDITDYGGSGLPSAGC